MIISETLRAEVEERAGYRCEYCLTIMDSSPTRFEVEHIIPLSKGGLTVLENLALACRGCNLCKYNKTHGTDDLTGHWSGYFIRERMPGKSILHGILAILP